MELGERLRRVRKDRDLNLREVSERTDLSISYLSDLERGRGRNPSMETIEKLAECYGMSVGDLLRDVGEEQLGTKTLPPELRRLVEREDSSITAEDARDLSRIEFRGKRPRSEDEWEALFWDLKTLLRETDDRRPRRDAE